MRRNETCAYENTPEQFLEPQQIITVKTECISVCARGLTNPFVYKGYIINNIAFHSIYWTKKNAICMCVFLEGGVMLSTVMLQTV